MTTTIHNSTTCTTNNGQPCEMCVAANNYERRRQDKLFAAGIPTCCSELSAEGEQRAAVSRHQRSLTSSPLTFTSISREWADAAGAAIAASDEKLLPVITLLALLGNALIQEAYITGQMGR